MLIFHAFAITCRFVITCKLQVAMLKRKSLRCDWGNMNAHASLNGCGDDDKHQGYQCACKLFSLVDVNMSNQVLLTWRRAGVARHPGGGVAGGGGARRQRLGVLVALAASPPAALAVSRHLRRKTLSICILAPFNSVRERGIRGVPHWVGPGSLFQQLWREQKIRNAVILQLLHYVFCQGTLLMQTKYLPDPAGSPISGTVILLCERSLANSGKVDLSRMLHKSKPVPV